MCWPPPTMLATEAEWCGSLYGGLVINSSARLDAEMSELPKPPTGLRAPGREMWHDVVSRYIPSAGELQILRRLARAVDTADRIERALLKELSVPGYNGRPDPTP